MTLAVDALFRFQGLLLWFILATYDRLTPGRDIIERSGRIGAIMGALMQYQGGLGMLPESMRRQVLRLLLPQVFIVALILYSSAVGTYRALGG